nr:membrane glycoprotein UL119 [Mastomys natalensis cytomegalovirus 3]WEG69936.1 membrane glycoprotein UL119 [Mastomys natalensis cytomegalovirus 3]WEG70076.1 membrane glycoprotein UL119 [Mastomys natalensis cytomegalovirus 3]WEG70216.1 membrane glycoprotein UL119 [Mastomys natalensis cytomegalovirus 3]WEG70356.1 membrane glycoprotein UL119 [Mastomys natalensis cytomegalovirus 3]
MLRLLVVLGLCSIGLSIYDARCPSVDTMWHQNVHVRCPVNTSKDGGVFVLECFKRTSNDASWEKVVRLQPSGPIYETTHNGTMELSYNNSAQTIDVLHKNVTSGMTFFECDVYHYQGAGIPMKINWNVTAYPMIKFQTGFRIKDIIVTVAVKNNLNMSISVYHEPKKPFNPVSITNTSHNGLFVYTMTFVTPWSDSKGNATVDVTVGDQHYKKTFLFQRHSTSYYTALASLMIVACIILLAYIVYRIKWKKDSPFRYMRQL